MTNYSYGYGYPMFNANATLTPVAQALLSIWNSDGSADYPVGVLDYPENTTSQYRINEEGNLELAPAYIAPVWDGKRLERNIVSTSQASFTNWTKLGSAGYTDNPDGSLSITAGVGDRRFVYTTFNVEVGSYVLAVDVSDIQSNTNLTRPFFQLNTGGGTSTATTNSATVKLLTLDDQTLALNIEVTVAGTLSVLVGVGSSGYYEGDYTINKPAMYNITGKTNKAPPEYVPVGVGIGEFLPELSDKGDMLGTGTTPDGWSLYVSSKVTDVNTSEGVCSFTTGGHLSGIAASGGFLANPLPSGEYEYTIRARRVGAQQSSEALYVHGGPISNWQEVVPTSVAADEWNTYTAVGDGNSIIFARYNGDSNTVTYEIDYVHLKSTAQPSTQLDGAIYLNTANPNSVDDDGVVTQGAEVLLDPDTFGVYLAGGGGNFIPEPHDLSLPMWKKRGAATVNTVATGGYIPDRPYSEISGLSGGNTNDVFDQVNGFTQSELSLQLAIKQVTSSGTLSILNPMGPLYGEWSLDLSLLSSDWEYLDVNHPAVTENAAFTPSSNQAGVHFRNTSATPVSVNVQAIQLEESPAPTRFTEHSSVAATAPVEAAITEPLPDEGEISFILTALHDVADYQSLVDVVSGNTFIRSSSANNWFIYHNDTAASWYSYNGASAIGLTGITWAKGDRLHAKVRFQKSTGAWQLAVYNLTTEINHISTVSTNFTGWVTGDLTLTLNSSKDWIMSDAEISSELPEAYS